MRGDGADPALRRDRDREGEGRGDGGAWGEHRGARPEGDGGARVRPHYNGEQPPGGEHQLRRSQVRITILLYLLFDLFELLLGKIIWNWLSLRVCLAERSCFSVRANWTSMTLVLLMTRTQDFLKVRILNSLMYLMWNCIHCSSYEGTKPKSERIFYFNESRTIF